MKIRSVIIDYDLTIVLIHDNLIPVTSMVSQLYGSFSIRTSVFVWIQQIIIEIDWYHTNTYENYLENLRLVYYADTTHDAKYMGGSQ